MATPYQAFINKRIRRDRRRYAFYFSSASLLALLGLLIGAGWAYLPNIIPLLAATGIVASAPLAIMLGLAGFAAGLFIATQLVHLGKAFKHIFSGYKVRRSWAKILLSALTAAVLLTLIATGAIPIAATSLGGALVTAGIVLLGVALTAFLSKHIARFYSKQFSPYMLDAENKPVIGKRTNPEKYQLSSSELEQLKNLNGLLPADTISILQDINYQIYKHAHDPFKVFHYKAALQALHDGDIEKLREYTEIEDAHAKVRQLEKTEAVLDLNKKDQWVKAQMEEISQKLQTEKDAPFSLRKTLASMFYHSKRFSEFADKAKEDLRDQVKAASRRSEEIQIIYSPLLNPPKQKV